MLICFNKPYGVLSQFSSEAGHPGLAAYIQQKRVYAAGRLDHDSEGLLLLTDEPALASQIAQPKYKWPKTYLAQVEGEIGFAALTQLRLGVPLNDGMSLPAQAEISAEPAWLWPRDPPIRTRLAIPTSWLQLTLTEGAKSPSAPHDRSGRVSHFAPDPYPDWPASPGRFGTGSMAAN